MVSNTKQTESIRHRKNAAAGRKRKNAMQAKGTTASAADLFKVHPAD